MRRIKHSRFAKKLVPIALAGCLFVVGGCSIWDSKDDPESDDDICEDVFGEYADRYFPNVTRTQCTASTRGEWIEETGRCYCHSLE